MITRFTFAASLVAVSLAGGAEPARQPFEETHRLIKPQAGESLWAAIPWEISLQQARQRSVREDKPLFLWRAGGGDVLGRA